MGTTRTIFSPDFKAKVALAAIRGGMTINEIASQFGVHGNQVVRWKKQAQAELAEVFSDKREKRHASEAALREELYRQIGQLKVELDWLKKTRNGTSVLVEASLTRSLRQLASGVSVSFWESTGRVCIGLPPRSPKSPWT